MQLSEIGYVSLQTKIVDAKLRALRERFFVEGEAGSRGWLDEPLVREVAIELREQLVAAQFLPAHARAIQAIAFDKSASANWKVTWHQDLMFPFAHPVTRAGFDQSSKKEGIDYARPPRTVLEELTAVRLHLDDCDDSNGPLRVSPGSHAYGILRSAEIPDYLSRHGEAVCLAKAGDALLMKPLLLHASSRATEPKHRRVLHIVYYSGNPIAEQWYRAI